MAVRPCFKPTLKGSPLVETIDVEFVWFSGFSVTQKQKCIQSLHKSAGQLPGMQKLLEVSSKSEESNGRRLSAFNLPYELKNGSVSSVESVFQGSKVFSSGGPYSDLYLKSSIEAKTDTRIKKSGRLVHFDLEGERWPLEPKTMFYDWLYVSALHQQEGLRTQLMAYDAFSDIEFNPKKSINCQARSVAIYKALVNRGLIDIAMSSIENFKLIYERDGSGQQSPIKQPGLF